MAKLRHQKRQRPRPATRRTRRADQLRRADRESRREIERWKRG